MASKVRSDIEIARAAKTRPIGEIGPCIHYSKARPRGNWHNGMRLHPLAVDLQ